MLEVRGVTVEVGGRVLIENVSFTARARDKIGLVGRNGAGKTSLMKVLGGGERAKTGIVRCNGGLGYLSQDPRLDGIGHISAVTHVLSGRGFDVAASWLEKLRIAMEEDASDRNVTRYVEAEEQFRNSGGYSADAEARRMAVGLGLAADRLDLAIGVLSGGERRRVELARILYAGSDALLLDEPTNHLDSDAKDWLLKFLRSYPGALVVISHDLELLDEAITRVIHLDRPTEEGTGRFIEYKGTYSQYKLSREADEVRMAKVAAQQGREIERLSTLADRIRAKATLAAKAQDLDKRVARIEAGRVEAPRKERQASYRLPKAPHCARTVMEAAGLTKSYRPNPPVFSDVTFALEKGETLLIMGFNGAGKTSLLRLLAGETEADRGTVSFGRDVTMGYYAQEHENVDGNANILTNVQGAAHGMSEREVRSLLGMFGLVGDKVFQEAGTLSGGEKTKVSLAQLCAGSHNLLLLDEPTNNLDPPSRVAIADALAGWDGAMVVVSHDIEFVTKLRPDRVLSMPEGTLDYWSDDLAELVALA